jgi:hypothetical protein
LRKGWTVEEEKRLVSVVMTFGPTNWAKIAANVPGRDDTQCSSKWRNLSKKAGAAVSGAWTVEEEKKLVSAVETFGTNRWAEVAVKVPGRNETQCCSKWRHMSGKAVATTSGAWTVQEEKKLVSAVESLGTASWAKVAANIPGRNEIQCCNKWQYLSKKAAATASGTWTAEVEKKLVSAVETFGTASWTKIAGNVPGRNENQCKSKWHSMSRKFATNVGGTWTVEEEIKLVSAVDIYGGRNWAKVAADVPGRNEIQCCNKWQYLSKKATATTRGVWTVEEENKLASAVETFGTASWARVAAKVLGRNESQCKSKWQSMSRNASTTADGTWMEEEEKKLVSAVETYGGRNWVGIANMVPGRNASQCLLKWQSMDEQTAVAESAPAADAKVLSQLSGLEAGPDLHNFPRDSQNFLALLGITSAHSLLESNVEYLAATRSYVGKRTLSDMREVRDSITR